MQVIYILDDNLDRRIEIVEALNEKHSSDWTVNHTGKEDEAIKYISNNPVDLVICDVCPDPNAPNDIRRRVADTVELLGLPCAVIMFTGQYDSAIRQSFSKEYGWISLRENPNDWVEKLVSLAERHLNKKRDIRSVWFKLSFELDDDIDFWVSVGAFMVELLNQTAKKMDEKKVKFVKKDVAKRIGLTRLSPDNTVKDGNHHTLNDLVKQIRNRATPSTFEKLDTRFK